MGSRSWDSSRDHSQESQEHQDRTQRKERSKDKRQSTIVQNNVSGSSSLHGIKKSSVKTTSKYETLKDMLYELRQCSFKEQYGDLLHRILTFIDTNGEPPRQFVVPCKWNAQSSMRGSSKMGKSGSQFNSGGASPPSSDDSSSLDGA